MSMLRIVHAGTNKMDNLLVHRRKLVKFLTVVLVSVLLTVVLVKHYGKPIFEITKGDYLTYRAFQADRNSLEDIKIIHGEIINLRNKSREMALAPETKLHDLCDQLNTIDRSKMTSPEYSKITFVTINNDGVIFVSIHTYDMLKRPNANGNDVIVVWAFEKNGDGRVSGEVIDHKNGSYTGIITPFWSGQTVIKAKLASSIINTCLKMKAIQKYGNAVFAMQQGWGIRGTFKKNRIVEITPCGANPTIFGYINICNLTNLNGGMPWYCGKPKENNLHCSNILSFGTGKFDTKWASQLEKIQNAGHGVFRSTVIVNIQLPMQLTPQVSCNDSDPNISWENKATSGYWINGTWHMTNCKSSSKQDFRQYRTCLRGKTIFIVGDSTLRQYADFILRKILGIDDKFKQASVGVHGEYHDFKNMYEEHGIILRYLKHEMPFHNPGLPSLGIKSTPQLFESLASENISDLVVIANYNSHFTAYPPFVYRHCQKVLKTSFRKLKLANPSARLFVKKPHLVIDDSRWFDPHIELLNTAILREEFSDVRDKVFLLDNWSISVTHNSQQLHPVGDPMVSQMHQFLSYIC